MTFIAPAALALAALSIPVVLLYMLRSRRSRTPVSSTMLWELGQRNVSANTPWQPLRFSWLLLLQLLALLLAVLAIARPARPTALALAEHTVLIVDTSASMRADDGGRTRLEAAKREALKAVEQLSGSKKMSVIAAGPRARVVLSGSSDRRALVEALSALAPTDGPTDAGGAFSLGASLETADVPTIMHFYSDGGVAPEDRTGAPGALVHVPIGSAKPNAGIARMSIAPKGAGWDVFLRLVNTGTVRLDATLELRAGEQVAARQPVRLDPQRARDLTLAVARTTATALEARLVNIRPSADTVGTVEPGRADALPADDVARAVLERERALRVLLVTPGNVFLEAAIKSMPGAQVTVADKAPSARGYALAIYDRVTPPEDPGVPALAIAPPRGGLGARVTGTVKRPVITSVQPREPILHQVDLSRVAIREAQRIAAPGMRTLAGAGDDAMVAVGVPKGRRAAYIAFDLRESNLPVQVAWPLLFGNLVTWLTQADAGDRATLQAGDPLPLRVPGRTTRFAVRTPSGESIERPAVRAVFDETDAAGLYRVRYFAGKDPIGAETFALNVPPAESELTVKPVTGKLTERGQAGRLSGLRAWGPGILALVLVLLALEWWIAHGRPTPKRRFGRTAWAARSAP